MSAGPDKPTQPEAVLDDAAKAAHAQPSDAADAAAGEPSAEVPRPPADPRELRIKYLEAKLAEQEATLHSYIRAHKKAEAEFEAFRGRLERDRERELQVARGQLVEKLLGVGDNLERTIDATRRGGTRDSLLEGVELVLRQFNERLAALGLERVDPTGQLFDPSSMEAMGAVPVSDPAQDNRVIHTLQAGYRLGDREIRPAMVQVGRKT